MPDSLRLVNGGYMRRPDVQSIIRYLYDMQCVAVVGFSNWFYGAMMDPPHNSVDQPRYLIGQEAARLLITQIELNAKKKDSVFASEVKILKTTLVVRESSLRKSNLSNG